MTTTEPTTAINPLSQAHSAIASLPAGHFIDGTFVVDTDDTLEIVNPATGQTLTSVCLGDAHSVSAAVEAAGKAFAGWRRTTPGERAGVLFRIAAAIDEHAELFAQVEALNVGKPLVVAREEIPLAADALRFMAGAVRSAQSPAAGEYVSGHVSFVRREPVGVVGSVTPWNYPLMMAIWKLAPALAAGNTVVLKPSELTPLSTLLFAQLVGEFLPPGVLNIVVGTGPVVGEALTEHPGIAMVSLTGSVASGKAVAKAASASLKRTHLELGGKAPVVVFADANLDEVVDAIKVMGFWNTGQECGAATRVLCEASLHDELLAKLAEAISSIVVGDPAEGEHIEIGPLISEAQRSRVADLVAVAKEEGATVNVGGAALDRAGYFFEPTLISDVAPGTRAAREEIFGPVVTVEEFTGEAEAVQKANDVAYGLAASVWTERTDLALRMTDALDFGTVWVNSHLTLSSEMPWGGFGDSGYGRDMSILGLDDYTRTKHVMLAKRG